MRCGSWFRQPCVRANPDIEMIPRTFLFARKSSTRLPGSKAQSSVHQQSCPHDRRRPRCEGPARDLCSCPSTTSLRQSRLFRRRMFRMKSLTAGYEASGTSNMKFMMNGALTIGTRTAPPSRWRKKQARKTFSYSASRRSKWFQSRGWYSPHWHYDNEPETRAALDLILSDTFSRYEPGLFSELHDALLDTATINMHWQSKSYLGAARRLSILYRDPDASRKAILNVASSGKSPLIALSPNMPRKSGM